MLTKGTERRKKLLSFYNRNLLFYCPDATDQFICPICLNRFDLNKLNKEYSEVVLAHVFPKNMNGKLLTLSCRSCDNHIGTTYDEHISKEKKDLNFRMGRQKKPVKISYDSGRIPAYIKLSKEGEPPSISLFPVHPSEPEYPKFIENISSNGDSWKVNIEIGTGFVPSKRDISLIHSAFLMMFYCFGYEYILSANANYVRQIINGTNTSLNLKNLVSSFTFDKSLPVRLPAVGIIWEPREIPSFIVIVGSSEGNLRGIRLPGFGEKGFQAYHHLLSMETPPIHSKVRFLEYISIDFLVQPEYAGHCELAWDYFTSL